MGGEARFRADVYCSNRAGGTLPVPCTCLMLPCMGAAQAAPSLCPALGEAGGRLVPCSVMWILLLLALRELELDCVLIPPAVLGAPLSGAAVHGGVHSLSVPRYRAFMVASTWAVNFWRFLLALALSWSVAPGMLDRPKTRMSSSLVHECCKCSLEIST